MQNPKPTRSNLTLLQHFCNLTPIHLVPQLARDTRVDAQARTFRPWSHVVSLLYAQLTHSFGLNDVCDALGLHSGPLSAIRGPPPASKNASSDHNRETAQQLFWAMLEHLQQFHLPQHSKPKPTLSLMLHPKIGS